MNAFRGQTLYKVSSLNLVLNLSVSLPFNPALHELGDVDGIICLVSRANRATVNRVKVLQIASIFKVFKSIQFLLILINASECLPWSLSLGLLRYLQKLIVLPNR